VNAQLEPAPALRAMTLQDLAAVFRVESSAYSFPWSRGNFVDSLAAGYQTAVLEVPDGPLLGYFVAMVGVDEMHLLNITVAPPHQGQGHGRTLLQAVQARARELRLGSLWLEVRASNARARAFYGRRGFAEVGVRKGYYPAPLRREDAVVMSLAIVPNGAPDGVD
jgi:ribosomal-protein-alanine N-acetyltransferase